MRLTILLLTAPLVQGACLTPRQSAATQIVSLSSLENLAIRSNGQILATNMNSAQLYSVDPVSKTYTAALTVSGASPGLSGIGEVTPDVFAVIGGTKQVYKVDFTVNPPTSSLIATIQEANNLNGLAVFDNSSVLLADAGRGVVYKLNVANARYEQVLSDPTMTPTGGIPFGIDGIKYDAKTSTVWYTNIFRNSLHSLPVEPTTAKATGVVKTWWTNLMGDDLCLSGDTGKVYVTTNMGGNSLVELDPSVGEESRKTIGSVQGSTACAFGRREGDTGTVYVTGAQGLFAVQVK
ncbi:uncharacterized protein CTHT_0072340 [Thermochaetoides thermophila DSM 1495]|uniref:SMP-30/Gluconolactonase/LRE-like region domain-containing protein n=1 Tax=Chaetomium thermophilum (strain DSM 1495 / CBS 144.50 / IMI 039719) TaxID=759272 RepID=G0SFW1_CHATD|nr:hypothetical protein CTHT_0072340 [Thermochaetoides thermophila DSM 1495]EGS17876.1 hypothetical protein CTHT_0072340 [Thermochaetoides thermophila DSM 1495]